MEKMMEGTTYLLFDIGGSWIKAAVARSNGSGDLISETHKITSPLYAGSSVTELSTALCKLAEQLKASPEAIVVSTAGVVNYHGSGLELASPHLSALLDDSWIENLRTVFKCPVNLINDADCALIGAAEEGLIKGSVSLGLMVVGTGLGFSVCRNGRRWRPGGSYTLLGSVSAGQDSLDTITSASRLANHSPNQDLVEVLTQDEYVDVRNDYFKNLAEAMECAALLYQLDEVAIAGGLVDACLAAGVDLQEEIECYLENEKCKLRVFREGNRLQITGALAMAKAEAVAEKARFRDDFIALKTEQAYDRSLQLHKMTAQELVNTFLVAEQQAGERLMDCEQSLAECAELISQRLTKGGRLIYVGCGSSGRIAALDAVELPCTYGLSPDRAICLISGGVADATIDIEHKFEEDASCVPEMLLLDLNENDIVIGISASGSAYYVRSALAMAMPRNALTIMISVEKPPQPFYHHHIPLCSGGEVLSGSTRMKAGTATKKILNTLSSTAMILQGKVHGTKMIDLACVNQKLISRALGIIQDICQCDPTTAEEILEKHDFKLLDAVNSITKDTL